MSRGWLGWTDADLVRLGAAAVDPTAATRNKYHAKKTTVDGQVFDSAHEAEVWQVLHVEHCAGVITDLVRQRKFPLWVVPQKGDQLPILIGNYTADFVCRRDGQLEVIDAKSRATKTEAYQLRKKLFEALYGVVVTER